MGLPLLLSPSLFFVVPADPVAVAVPVASASIWLTVYIIPVVLLVEATCTSGVAVTSPVVAFKVAVLTPAGFPTVILPLVNGGKNCWPVFTHWPEVVRPSFTKLEAAVYISIFEATRQQEDKPEAFKHTGAFFE
jgi:hypothetical protein